MHNTAIFSSTVSACSGLFAKLVQCTMLRVLHNSASFLASCDQNDMLIMDSAIFIDPCHKLHIHGHIIIIFSLNIPVIKFTSIHYA